jgi:hypothetical protein
MIPSTHGGFRLRSKDRAARHRDARRHRALCAGGRRCSSISIVGDRRVFKQRFADHWDAFPQAHPLDQTAYCAGLVATRLTWGNPEKLGSVVSRGLPWDPSPHRVAMRCQSSLCLRCTQVYVDHWGSQVRQGLQEGVSYRHSSLTVPALCRPPLFPQRWALAERVEGAQGGAR